MKTTTFTQTTGLTTGGTLRAPLSGTFLLKKDVVNRCLEFALEADPRCNAEEDDLRLAECLQEVGYTITIDLAPLSGAHC